MEPPFSPFLSTQHDSCPSRPVCGSRIPRQTLSCGHEGPRGEEDVSPPLKAAGGADILGEEQPGGLRRRKQWLPSQHVLQGLWCRPFIPPSCPTATGEKEGSSTVERGAGRRRDGKGGSGSPKNTGMLGRRQRSWSRERRLQHSGEKNKPTNVMWVREPWCPRRRGSRGGAHAL